MRKKSVKFITQIIMNMMELAAFQVLLYAAPNQTMGGEEKMTAQSVLVVLREIALWESLGRVPSHPDVLMKAIADARRKRKKRRKAEGQKTM